MKKIFILYFTVLFFAGLKAQQLPLYSQYLENNYILNPGVAGSEKMFSPLKLSVHKQWIGIDQSPSTQYLTLHHRLANNVMGVGGMVFHDSFGPVRMLGIQSTYSYHLKVNRDMYVSMGLNAILMQYVIKLSQDDFYGYEPVLTRERNSVTVPDASVGFYAYSKKYWAGLSVLHLVQSRLKITGTWLDNTNKMVRHYFLMGGYRFSFPAYYTLDFEPSALLKFTETTPLQVDVNAKMYINKQVFLGASVRGGDSYVLMFGLNFDDYFFAISHDFTFSDLAVHTIGSQELIFGWNLGFKTRKGYSFQ